MKNTETFEIFGTDHVLTILFILVISLLIPYLLKNKSREGLYTFTSLLATVMIINEFGKAFYYPYLYPDRYEFFEMLPFFNLAFFWGIAGCSMALTQPDVPFKFPDANFLLYFFSHGLLLFAIMLSAITFRNRPNFEEFKKTVLISIPVVATIYLINITINFFVDGSPANYWYLIKFPDGANLTAFMPDPPAHLPIFFVLGLLAFGLIYLPFYIYDRFFTKN